MPRVSPTLRVKPDAVAVQAVDAARAALVADVGEAEVGDHLGHEVEGERLVTHLFACTRRGYAGWLWSVTVARASRQRGVTVDEIVLVPGAEAIVAPEWVPYKERVKPGDLSPGDLLPVEDDDPRLVPSYAFGDDPLDADDKAQVREVARELGLGRVRTLSREGRDLAAERWYAGDAGPGSPLAKAAPDLCTTCGFLVRLAGPLSEMFGVCANGNANDDGRVVSLDHGCGAHSEVQLARRHEPQPLPDHVYDTMATDELESF
ncbi:DUF3027 domain-containing protein [Nocardioides coralli]|uniref:DUF3027 domain-containing protein n=1 Tax=Nocardioides coralli TaxID=2872154 RepID=UPI002016CECE|nr:DUF3027 domain-containing protein [Nocardioides coralli]